MPLRLRSLELQGYKTFASKTTFEFASGITAIVGPNGSGKSNVADALRWVLGEQSYSLLRGKKTEDMIFNGSEQRARGSMASAHIVFDNTNGWLPVDFTEVGMTRRAYRDGHNDYLLNDQQVRLRDLNEILSASGLADRTYTIMGQGLVDASLALKAEERRKLFEEAAGVGLYRSRREEALKRLDNTLRNLQRVQDIMSELEPRLKSLERQAKRASEYSRAQADLKIILREWYGYHWHTAQKELTNVRDVLKSQEARLEEARTLHAAAQTAYNEFRERLSSLRTQVNTWHHQSGDLHAQREETSREIAVLEERRRALLSSQTETLSDQERAKDEDKRMTDRLSEVEGEIDRLNSEFQEAQSQYDQIQQLLQSQQSERSTLVQKMNAVRDQVSQASVQRAQTQARIDELTSRLESLTERMNASNESVAAAKKGVQEAELKLKNIQSERDKLQIEFTELEEKERTGRKALEKLEEEKRLKIENRSELMGDYARVNTQLEIIEQSEQTFAGFAEGARYLLEAAQQSKILGPQGALSSVIDVPPEYEKAITSALGDTLDAVLIDENQIDPILDHLKTDEVGRAVILPMGGENQKRLSTPKDENCLGVASDLVKANNELQSSVDRVLGQILVVKDRSAAKRLVREIPSHARIVTLDGEVFRGDGLIVAGTSASPSSLGRIRQKRELVETRTSLASHIDKVNLEIESHQNTLDESQKMLNELSNSLQDARQKLTSVEDLEKQAGLEFEAKSREVDWQIAQQIQIKTEEEQAAKSRKELIASQTTIESDSDKSKVDLKLLTDQLNVFELGDVQEKSAYWSTRAAVAQKALEDARARKTDLLAENEKLISRMSEIQSKLSEVEQAIADLDNERNTLHERESGVREKIETMHVDVSPAEKELESAEVEEVRLQDAEANAQRTLATAERLHGQVQLDQIRKQEALDNLRQKIMDDFGLVMFEYADEVAGPVPLPFEGMVEDLPVVTEVSPDLESQLTRQRTQVRRMGPINPEAKEEFNRESERYNFMRDQIDDLKKAEEDLRHVIAELDEYTRQEFSRTFEAVDKQFRVMFTRLFGGGSARLSLTDPNNLVETGIEIEARLPGRREQGLALLSGGERSLTAVALVFALLKVSPTPVCVMDEVDAMLDEANVGRFRDLLIDLSKETQFIVITHNRNTVQAADVIYGITMGRDSASQMISLRLDQVTDEMLNVA